MKRLSLNNGKTFVDVNTVKINSELLEKLMYYMENQAREMAATISDNEEEFLSNYLKYAKQDLIIG